MSRTLGAARIDYLIADATIVPDAHRRDYGESMIIVPTPISPPTTTREPKRTPSRAKAGLPR